MKNNNNMYVLYFYCTPYKESSAGVRTIYTMIDFIIKIISLLLFYTKTRP